MFFFWGGGRFFVAIILFNGLLLLVSKVDATVALNKAMSFLYSAGFWIQDWKAKRVANCFFHFLGSYQRLAYLTFVAGKARYQLIPKLHYMHHFAVDLDRQASHSRWAQNPLATSVQCQEDYVGRPSRASRRVNIRRLHRNVISRILILQCQALVKADQDQRGMNAYEID